MPPKAVEFDAIPGLGNKGMLTEFHTGIIWGLINAQGLAGRTILSQRAVSQLMGCSTKTVRNHLEKADAFLAEAEQLLKEKNMAKQARTETVVPPADEPTPDQKTRLKYLSRAIGRRDKRGFRKFTTARDYHGVLLDHDIAVSLRTVHRDLNSLGMQYKRRKRTGPLTEERMAKRVEVAKKLLEWSDEKLNSILFSDETYFRSEDFNRGQYVHAEEEAEPIRTTRYVPKVYVWGCIGVGFTLIVILDGHTTAEDYCDTLKNYLFADEEALGRPFMQDNARPHTAGVTKSLLDGLGVETLEWPPYSPDLNPIENLWAVMKRTLQLDCFTEEEELEAAILAWVDNIDQSFIDKYVLSFKSRLEKCVAIGGESIVMNSKMPTTE